MAEDGLRRDREVRGHTYNGMQGQGSPGERECSTSTADSMLRACLAEAAALSSLRAAAGSLPLHASAVPATAGDARAEYAADQASLL